MNTLDKLLNRFTRLNSGYDVSSRGRGTQLIVVTVTLVVIALAAMGAWHLAKG